MSKTHFAMVSEWMNNGTLNEFVEANPDINRLKLVRVSLEILLSLFTFSLLTIGWLAWRRC
jgi:hypothetical protein